MASELGQISPNGTNPGLFKISFQFILAVKKSLICPIRNLIRGQKSDPMCVPLIPATPGPDQWAVILSSANDTSEKRRAELSFFDDSLRLHGNPSFWHSPLTQGW